MARKRKSETKTAVKPPAKYAAVRKSSRQMAKKQLEDKRVNGTIADNPAELQTQLAGKKTPNSQRKNGKHKSVQGDEAVETRNNVFDELDRYKRDAGDSDSQDGSEVVLDSEKLSPEDVRQMVVGTPNDSGEPAPSEVEVWPEQVIEETIICEEMEVEGDAVSVHDGFTITQEGDVMMEQVLLVDEPNLEGKDYVRFAVIQNEHGTESMVMSSDTVIQESDGSLTGPEPETAVLRLYTDESQDSNSETLENSEKFKVKVAMGKEKGLCESKIDSDESKTASPISQSSELDTLKESSTESFSNNATRGGSDSSRTAKEEALDDKLSTMRISEDCKEIEKLVKDLESVDSPVQNFSSTSVEKMTIQDDESSSSILDKMEQLHRSNNPESVERSENVDDFLSNSSFFAGKLDSKSKPAEERKSRRNSSFLPGIRETLADSEYDSKIEREDVKTSSSSENSSDTMLSTNSCKTQDTDGKGPSNQPNDVDKKTEFRNRSGSIDTTGSESGSNSSGVRRSSRIRSIGLMKQRSHGRGLVTKPSTDPSKAGVQQDREKPLSNSASGIPDSKTNCEGQSETQSDNENNGTKAASCMTTMATTSTTTTMSTLTSTTTTTTTMTTMTTMTTTTTTMTMMLMTAMTAMTTTVGNTSTTTTTSTTMSTTTTPLASPAAPPGGCVNTGYDSDSSKPVKVKSRWRRSSELEMGSSGANFAAVSGAGFGFGLPPASASESSARLNGSTDPTGPGLTVGSQSNADPEKSSDGSKNAALPSTATTLIPKTVGAKISLPMVLEIKDREMEERLSQFEHLRENLYLTERYTNKETKRMVCDCFLTEEEFERGELGCGEDCLNRLLMIECGPRCVVGDRCTNKRFQNCEYAKCEVFRTEKKGFGLRAKVDLDAGEFIMEYVGEVVDPKDFRRRAKEYSKDKNRHYYFMALKSDQIIDATMKGNVSRFINHSCDPNAETQKWTVNGELRIGFFNKKFIAAGEEITFDYHFQRYGKEAQKCFCEATNCRGWIGDTPDEEKEKIEKKEKREKDSTRKKKEEKKSPDHMEDEDLKEEIDKLCLGGLKNRAHTLTLSRLMVRSRELEHRTRLLKVIQTGEQPCRRLFLDYHGLRLIWSYVMDVTADQTEEAQVFRLEVLRTLQTLPIPNKTMLMDSKIYGVVEKWAKNLSLSPNGDSPEDEQSKPKANGEEVEGNCDDKKSDQTDLFIKTEAVGESANNGKSENVEQSLIPALASSLLAEWSNLKEVFRIPKKERIEQMKEHEREADRGYREELEKEEKRGTSYDRHRSDRYVRGENDKRSDRRRGRDSPESEHSRTKDKKPEERTSLVPIPRMTKYERRQLFALKVAKEEEERQRRQQQESWQEHEARCLALGIDPHTTAMVDPQTGYPLFFNPALGQWQHYPMQEGGEVAQQCTPVYVGGPHGGPAMMGQNSHLLTPPISSDISSGMASGITTGIGTGIAPGTSPVVYSLNQPAPYNPTTTSYPLLSHRHQQYPADGQLPLSTAHNGTPPMPMQTTQSLYADKSSAAGAGTGQRLSTTATAIETPPQPEIPPIDLPPKWKSARDARGRVYYYHVKERVSQWLPPPPDHIGVQPDSSSSSESSEESSSSNEDEDDLDYEQGEDSKNEDVDMEVSAVETAVSDTKLPPGKKVEAFGSTADITPVPETKKRRDGLVQERIISPRREEDRIDHKRYKEIKDKLRRQKERAKLKEHVDKLRKHRRSSKSKSHSRHSTSKVQTVPSDATTISERKIKDAFRINMANVMVHFLNPYRKNDCRQGRITNTEDFKHLARKLTHFVLAKELKHCKSVDELQCNDNVKHKAKDFVRKYMSKFGAVYQKGTDED